MNRKQKALRHINKDGYGVEIGPSHRPLAPKKEGYKVHIIDHANQEQLRLKYKDHGVDTASIEEVDFIWQGESYAELTGQSKFYDWIIASHLVEHTPDLIDFLNNCDAILKDDGVISLVIPDKRFCFDHYRAPTSLSQIIDSHFYKNNIHTPGTVAEYFLNFVSKADLISWDTNTYGEYKLVHSRENAVQGMAAVIEQKAYLDVHAWYFVPHSFRLIIHDLYSLGFIHLQEVDFFPTERGEFFVTLGRQGQGLNCSRLEALKLIESEIQAGDSASGNSPLGNLAAKVGGVLKWLKNRLTT